MSDTGALQDVRQSPYGSGVSIQKTTATYDGSARVVNWGESGGNGMWANLLLLDTEPDDIHPFKGLRVGKDNGQLLQIGIVAPWLQNDPIYADDGLLLWWSDDPRGMLVRVALNDGPDGPSGHPMRGLSHGLEKGDTIEVRVYAYDDTHRVVSRKRRRNTRKQCIIKCRNDIYFRRWLRDNAHSLVNGQDVVPAPESAHDPGEAFAAEVVRLHLGSQSRGVLDQDTKEGRAARARWIDLVRRFEDEETSSTSSR